MAIHEYGLIADTHGHVHPRVFELFDGVEAIFHAGDVCGEDVMTELRTIAPVFAVAGNCDWGGDDLPNERIEETSFGKIALSHGHLIPGSTSRPEKFVEHFADQKPRIVLFGHSHIAYKRQHEGVWVANPGAAGKPRFKIIPSLIRLRWNSETDAFVFDQTTLDWSPSGRRIHG